MSDQTIATVGNDQNDVLDLSAYPKTRYEEQIELLLSDLKRPRKRKNRNGVEEEFNYCSRIIGVRGNSTGMGDFPMQFLQSRSELPIGQESLVKLTLQSRHEMYTKREQSLVREPGDPLRFSYPADHSLAPALEEQTIKLVRDYKGDGKSLCVHDPDEPDAHDDFPDATALMVMVASGGGIGDIRVA